MKLTLSKEHNVNYIATVVKIKEILPIKGADKIAQVIVDGFSVVVDKSTKVGDIFIFCPIDSRLNPELLRNNNLYSDIKLNKHYLETPNAEESDIEFKRGFFNKNGKVKPITLRKTPSQGFLIKPEMLSFIEGIDIDFSKEVGTRFDTIGDFLLLKKFVVPTKEVVNSIPISRLSSSKKKAIHDLAFHYNTPMLNRNLNHLSLDDELIISIKVHGTSAIFSKRSYKPKRITDRIKNFFGLYKGNAFIAASRTKIRDNDNSIWVKVGDKLEKYLPDNITVYGEILGYDGYKMIQKGYDYGCEPGECLFMPYRVVKHNEDGTDVEYTMEEVLKFSIDLQAEVCDDTLKIMPPHLVYRGDVRHLLPDLNNINEDTWRDDLLNKLINRKEWFMEKNEPLCKNKVPREGIVLRLEGHADRAVYKLKCQKFYERESAELDNL